MKGAALVCAGACLVLAACSEERPTAPELPVYDVDVAPILQARCVACHGNASPAGGWVPRRFWARSRVRRAL